MLQCNITVILFALPQTAALDCAAHPGKPGKTFPHRLFGRTQGKDAVAIGAAEPGDLIHCFDENLQPGSISIASAIGV
ncbi:MAG: hypothetical protein EBY25_01040 [Betaproteobacteria bacterium]|nr:hypothetical protein [Betaproteobacteria bacterium]